MVSSELTDHVMLSDYLASLLLASSTVLGHNGAVVVMR